MDGLYECSGCAFHDDPIPLFVDAVADDAALLVLEVLPVRLPPPRILQASLSSFVMLRMPFLPHWIIILGISIGINPSGNVPVSKSIIAPGHSINVNRESSSIVC